MPWWHVKTRKNKTNQNKTNKKKKYIPKPGPNQCHPRVFTEYNKRKGLGSTGEGCLPQEVYEKAWTILNKDQAKKGGGISSTNSNTKQKLIDTLSKQLGVDKNNQRSLLNSLPLTPSEKESLGKQWLRPEMPSEWKKDPDMWLDSLNIRDVMKQYEDYDKQFKFLGPYPIDFAAADPEADDKKECLIDEICNLNLDREELNGKTKIGIIFNLDPHYKNGSHWIACFIDVVKNECYYFDSYGMKPPKQIYKFMQWLTLQEPTMKLGWNGRRFQRSDSECGMYCMYFLDRMIAGESFLKFCRRAPPDSFMLDLRDWMFST
jgi:hypothetical protein